MKDKIYRVGIIGGAGYTAGELLRLLFNHPDVEIAFVHSSSNPGTLISEVHSGLEGDSDLCFSDSYNLNDIDVLFLCQGHGFSRGFWDENPLPAHLKVIDLAQDFRDESEGYVYGLPELNLDRIKAAGKVANPGCFATAIQLSILPLAKAGLLNGTVTVTALTGSTGAGVKPSASTHFSWRNNNISVYKPFEHRHLEEIRRSLASLMPEGAVLPDIVFVPVRGDFPRGIFSIATLDCSLPLPEVEKLYGSFYAASPFVKISPRAIDLKQVVNTNKALIHLDSANGHLLVTCAIDNLLKGASGQAVQNMNLMLNLPQTTALNLKASAF